eukprot:2701319-Prymnesium_polylepis.1
MNRDLIECAIEQSMLNCRKRRLKPGMRECTILAACVCGMMRLMESKGTRALWLGRPNPVHPGPWSLGSLLNGNKPEESRLAAECGEMRDGARAGGSTKSKTNGHVVAIADSFGCRYRHTRDGAFRAVELLVERGTQWFADRGTKVKGGRGEVYRTGYS